MNIYKLFIAVFILVFVSFFTGCYTEVATTDPSGTVTQADQNTSGNYYDDDQGTQESGYFAETDTTNDNNETTIINKYYYGYPYHSNYIDYYPAITFGIAVGWGWGYCGWYPYWPYYSGWCGYGWYDPYYYNCYYPGYYYYYPPYYYYPYYDYGYGYSYYNGYKTRNDYVSGLRNNSGGRNYGGRTRDPLNTVTVSTVDRTRDDLTRGRNIQVSSNNVTDRNLGIRDKGTDLTRDNVNIDQVSRQEINNTKTPRSTNSGRDLLTVDKNSGNTRNTKELGLTIDGSNKKYLGRRDQVNDVVKQLGIRDINTNKGNETKSSTNRYNSNNTNYKPRDNQNIGKDNTPKTYSRNNNNNTPKSYNPPKRNDNPTRTYTPPRTNNNPPRSYNPPSNNTPPRTNSSPNRSGGNSGGRRR